MKYPINPQRDNLARGFQLGRSLARSLAFSLSTRLGRLQGWLVGASLGADVKFYGKPYLQRAKGGQLRIGACCRFRSTPTSNFIGIDRPCILTVDSYANLVVGDRCGFSGTVIGCFSEIVIESDVLCGANTLITDSDWHPEDLRSGPPRPVHVERNVWIGVNAIVLKGVSIGRNSVIGAGSVVTRSIPENVIAAGNPCKVIRKL